METNPPDPAARAQLARVRARLTSLVERRLQFGLTPDEEADYQRLTGVERELLRVVGESGAAEAGGEAGTADDDPVEAGTVDDDPVERPAPEGGGEDEGKSPSP